MEQPTNGQRALFTFLGYSLVGAFLGGFAVFAGLILAPLVGLAEHLPADLPNPGLAGMRAFVWSAVPATLAGLALALVVLRQGSFHWLAAAVAGGVAFTVTAIVLPPGAGVPLTALTALAAFVAIGVRQALKSGGVIS